MAGLTTVTGPLRIYGRSAQLHAVDALLTGVREGRGGALVLAAAPGLGRSTLLAHAVRSFRSLRSGTVLSTRAVPAESLIPYSGVHSLWCTGAAPRPLPEGPGAVLAVVRELAGGRPLLVCVDDAHLWDAASRAALGYAARRLGGPHPVGLILSVAACRADDPQLAALPVVHLDPLAPAETAALFDDLTRGVADTVVRGELLQAAGGNPGTLRALVAALTPQQLAGRVPLPRRLCAGSVPAYGGVDPAELPYDTAELLLLAAAAHEPGAAAAGADAEVVLRAGAAAGLDDASLLPAEAAGLVRRTADRIRFDAPGLRRSLYAGAAPVRRRAAHRLLASVLDDSRTSSLLRLLHCALATEGSDARLATALAAAADAPGTAPSHALRAAALSAAADLTEPPRERALRRAAAAHHARLAGRPARARELLAVAQSESTDARVRGAVELTRGQLALDDGPVTDAREALLLAADLLAPHDPQRAREARLGAMAAAWDMGDAEAYLAALGTPPDTEAYAAALDTPQDTEATRPAPAGADHRAEKARPDESLTEGSPPEKRLPEESPAEGLLAEEPLPEKPLADGSAPGKPLPKEPLAEESAPEKPSAEQPPIQEPPTEETLAEEYRAAMSIVMRGRLGAASRGLRGVVARGQGAEEPSRLLRAGVAALVVGDLAAASRINARALAAARASGTEIHVPKALEYLAYAELRAGRHARARAHAEDGLRAARRTGQRNIAAQHHAILALVASMEGEDEAVAGHAAAAARTADRHGLAQAATLVQWALARVDLGRGRAPEAAARLAPVVRPGPRRGHFAVRMLAVPCFVEAASLAGEADSARVCVEEFAAWAAQGADPQAPAQLARCHALLAAPEDGDALYRVALARHELVGGDFESARTQLLYGKWLRRRRRPGEARGRLRDALVSFERCGARAWAEQARAELRATGEARAAEPPGGLSGLTPQQLRIARCVAEGATNREVARRLSVSPRTVDHHLRNVFALLGVRSRVELSRLVARSEQLTAHDEP
ncbi:LuxR C-terminal-related transcriptional regulator [Streptomyces sp. KN37]|uniref:LuxR C-terminal-related transcriptional regulator n=1 Tax=Streptomyces sp. KN37 TaxID=3090667 RepID=UPI002A752981|nr:LuxR C-terminal-related transcriptional regulator [Streptomyces sp. KN37]WPO76436.1 LuxR C-terminal-related transcriptional regulator [Streptomyces sp. KN37]